MISLRQPILDYAKSLGGFPTLGAVTRKLSLVLAERESSFSRLLEIVQYDPGLSARIISVSNSVWHSRGVPVVSLKRAMTALGLEEVKNVVTCALFYDGVLKKLGLKKAYTLALWKHSLLVALGGRALGNQEQDDMDKAFTAGLLHDIGKVPLQLLYQYDGNKGQSGWEDACADEKERFGIDHQEIGFYLATEWKLPDEYRQAIRLHHEKKGESPLARLVGNADLLMSNETEDQRLLAMKSAVEAEAAKIISLFSV